MLKSQNTRLDAGKVFRIYHLLGSIIGGLFGLACGLDPTFSDDVYQEFMQPLFARYCVECHGRSGQVNGEVDLLAVRTQSDLLSRPELVRRLQEVIELREMPPEGEAKPHAAERNQLLLALRNLLDESLAGRTALPHVSMRRMNRFQYNNAVIDLFQLDCVVFTLPEKMMRGYRDYFRPETGRMPDTVFVGSRPLGKSQLIEPRLAGVAAFPQDLRAEHGFDNQADHLSLSPLLMEAFLKLGQSITESPDFNKDRVGIWNDFFQSPDPATMPETAVRQRLEVFLQRAFRRPADAAEVRRYASLAMAELESGSSFTEAMKATAAAVLASPKFIYLYSTANEGEAMEPLRDFELASRLSFFLWGSIPDDRLIELAAASKLSEPDVLEAEVDRMLADEKLKRFCDSFPTQWLQLERLVSSVPDPELYPDFYFAKYRDSMHMMLEPLLLFETILIENLPITQFLDSDFTYRSRLLRESYGEKLNEAEKKRRRANEVTILTFDRQTLSDRRYGGIITNAAVLTMTSGQQRTKPISRGAWVRSVVFNDPPDPPPADVPPLPEEEDNPQEPLTLRERLESHRRRADCRGCHEKIDSLGFALENFDPVGGWREHYENGREIDVSGILFGEYAFENLIEFKDALLANRDRFSRALAGRMLSFALARELEITDMPEVQRIANATASDNYRMKTLIKQVVLSRPFRNKQNPRQP